MDLLLTSALVFFFVQNGEQHCIDRDCSPLQVPVREQLSKQYLGDMPSAIFALPKVLAWLSYYQREGQVYYHWSVFTRHAGLATRSTIRRSMTKRVFRKIKARRSC